jgi:glycosyltransferase involved in cell wall biosynthesis
MRIAFFSTMAGLPWGGSEELWSRAAKKLLADGHDVAFNCLRWPTTANQLTELVAAGAEPHFRSRFRLGRTLRRSLEQLRLLRLKYRGWLRKARPDFVVASFSYHADDAQIAVTCRRMGIPYAIVLQAAGPHDWIAQRYLDDFRAAYEGAEQCYFLSAQNRETIEVNLGIDLSRSAIIDNPFSVSPQAAPAWPGTDQGWNLACVARIHFPSKSQDVIASVLRQPKWRSRPLKVTMWGRDEGFLPQFERLIELYGIQNQLQYGGFATDIEDLWSRHHGLLLPSRMEGNALSLVEAMMCRRMPITTNVGRAAELIDDNESGFIAPAATVELVDNALERAWQRRHEWRQIGERAGRAIRERHSLTPAEDFAEEILSLATGASPRLRIAA